MKLELNIYSKKRDKEGNRLIEKKYEVESYDVLYGTIEDVLNLFDGADFNDNEQLVKVIMTAKNQVNDLLKDIFYGLTDEELKKVALNDVTKALIGVLKYAIFQMMSEAKNAMRG